MTILNLGSINIDRVLRVPALPKPGETLAATSETLGLGGKGANQSIAIARSGGTVTHLGAVGDGGQWLIDRLTENRVDARHVQTRPGQSGQAFVMLADDGENSIVLLAGANAMLADEDIEAAIAEMAAGDWLLCQNETNGIEVAVDMAKKRGLKVVYAAAPFRRESVAAVLDRIDLLAVNAVEYEQLRKANLEPPENVSLLVTDGAAGTTLRHEGSNYKVPAFPAKAVDTTAAGDTFLGAFLARLDLGESAAEALVFASAAAALQVERLGAGDVIPTYVDVAAFRRNHPGVSARAVA